MAVVCIFLNSIPAISSRTRRSTDKTAETNHTSCRTRTRITKYCRQQHIALKPHSSQLQTWLQTWSQTCVSVSQAGRKHVESQLRTCLKRFFFYIPFVYSTHSRTRTNEPAASISTCRESRLVQQVSDQVFDKTSRKLVESMSQTRTNLSKTWLQTWSKSRFAARFAAR